MSKKEKDTLHIYSRVSTKGQSEKGMSLNEQKSKGIELSKRLGMKYKIYDEGGKSSYTDDLLNRPILLRLIDGFKDGSVKNIYVKDFDRLSRKGVGWYVILRDIEKFNITVYVGEGNKYDIDDVYDKLMFTIMSGVTQFDNEQRKRRLHLNKIRKFNEGYYIHSTTPFGYEKYEVGVGKKLKENVEESKIVKTIYNLFSKGKTVKDIQTYLLKNNIKSPLGNFEWGLQSIHNTLQSRTYIGEVSFLDNSSKTEYKNKCKRLIDDKLWFSVQKRFTDYYDEQQQKRKQTHTYLLTSFLYCGVCGYRMRGRKNPKKYENIYYCGTKEEGWRNSKHRGGCDRKRSKSVNIDRLDEVVWNEVLSTLKESKVLREMRKKSITMVEGEKGEDLVKEQLKIKKKEKKEFEKERTNLQKKESKLWEYFVNGSFENDEEFNKLLKMSKKNIWEINSQIEELDVFMSRLYESKRWIDWLQIYMDKVDEWEGLTDLKLKKDLLQQYIEKVDIQYDTNDLLHKVSIHLRLHLFNDKIVFTSDYLRDKKGRIKKGREYVIEEGEKTKSVYIPKNKVGRKKKTFRSENDIDLNEKNVSVTSTINEDKKYPTTETVYYSRVDGLGGILSQRNPNDYKVFLSYKISIHSGSLWNSPISNYQLKVYKEIKKLRKESLTYKQISNNLNERGWKTVRGKEFMDSGVHSSEMKMDKRMKMMGRYKSKVEDLQIEFDYDIEKEIKNEKKM